MAAERVSQRLPPRKKCIDEKWVLWFSQVRNVKFNIPTANFRAMSQLRKDP
jgi:hypothetical protein